MGLFADAKLVRMTPPNLKPPVLASLSFRRHRCQFELGNTAMMIHYLTDPAVASHRQLDTDWSVAGLLAEVAKSNDPPFHALIDGGALVTGMTNLEVARCVRVVNLNAGNKYSHPSGHPAHTSVSGPILCRHKVARFFSFFATFQFLRGQA